MKFFNSCRGEKAERGMALPLTLFLSLAVLMLSGIYTSLIKNSSEIVKTQEHSKDMFYLSEGVIHSLLGDLSINSHLWLEQPPIYTLPNNYLSFNPYDYLANNGIPTCTGIACQRHMYPEGGGLLKNFGPLMSSGSNVDQELSVTAQLNQETLPTPDVKINNQNAWSQLERLDEASLGAGSIGVDTSNNPASSAGTAPVRFRITGKAQKNLKGEMGQSTIVVIIEVPPV